MTSASDLPPEHGLPHEHGEQVEREELLASLIVGDVNLDDPNVARMCAANAEFESQVRNLIELGGLLDRAGKIKREVEQTSGQSWPEEHLDLKERFREILNASMDLEEDSVELKKPESQLQRPNRLRFLGPSLLAAAAAILLTWWIGKGPAGSDPPAVNDPYQGVLLGDGDLEPQLTLDPSGEGGILNWAPVDGAGRYTVRILEGDSAEAGSPRSLLEKSIRSGSSLQLDPLPWSAKHDTILIQVEYRIGGMDRAESSGELRLPPSL